MKIGFNHLYEIDEIIENKGWGTLVNNKGEQLKDAIFKFLDIVSTDDEYILIKNLIVKYFLCTDYSDYCYSMYKQIESIFSGENIVVIPLLDKGNKIKSGHSVAYDLTRFIDESKFKEFLILESLDSIFDRIDQFYIIVVDDFVGTGTQFRTFSRCCSDKYKIDAENIFLFSIAIMKRARSRIVGYCYDSFACIEFDRTLTDDTALNTLISAVAVYDGIERRVGIGRKYRRGFMQTEALITLKKTPNNTLPIFWCSKSTTGDVWPAVFPR